MECRRHVPAYTTTMEHRQIVGQNVQLIRTVPATTHASTKNAVILVLVHAAYPPDVMSLITLQFAHVPMDISVIHLPAVNRFHHHVIINLLSTVNLLN